MQSCLSWEPVNQKIDQVQLGLEPFRNIHSPACSISMCGRQPPRTQSPGKNAQPYHQKWSNGQGFCIQSSCFGADKKGCATNKVQNAQKFCGIWYQRKMPQYLHPSTWKRLGLFPPLVVSTCVIMLTAENPLHRH